MEPAYRVQLEVCGASRFYQLVEEQIDIWDIPITAHGSVLRTWIRCSSNIDCRRVSGHGGPAALNQGCSPPRSRRGRGRKTPAGPDTRFQYKPSRGRGGTGPEGGPLGAFRGPRCSGLRRECITPIPPRVTADRAAFQKLLDGYKPPSPFRFPGPRWTGPTSLSPTLCPPAESPLRPARMHSRARWSRPSSHCWNWCASGRRRQERPFAPIVIETRSEERERESEGVHGSRRRRLKQSVLRPDPVP